jgi:general secretion pathway protein N
MRRILLAVIVVVALAVAIAAFLPASLADSRLATATQGKLRLADATGTVWDGGGTLTDAAGTWRLPVQWRIAPGALLRGTRELELLPAAGATTPRGTVAMEGDGIVVRNLTLDIPAAALATVLPLRVLPAFGGMVNVTAPAFTFSPSAPTGSLDARWTGARLGLLGATADLGDVRLALAPRGNALGGTLSNDGGDLRIEGTLDYTAPQLGIDATVAPTPAAPPAVTRLLALAGTPDATGRLRFAWRGNVR